MKVHEYQARELLRQYGITVPQGVLARTGQEAAAAAARLGGRVMIKAQALTGGRGKAGAIRAVSSPHEAQAAAEEILPMSVNGFPVRGVLVSERIEIGAEYYAGLTIDRQSKSVLLILSAAGGMDIEEIAAHQPQKIRRFILSGGDAADHLRGGSPGGDVKAEGLVRSVLVRAYKIASDDATTNAPDAAAQDGARSVNEHVSLEFCLAESFADRGLLDQAVQIVQSMYRLFREKDCSLVEINPLAVTPEGRLVAADAKVVFDDNGLARHPEIAELRNPEEYTPEELEAKEAGLSFVSLSGDIGCMVNGAGLAMATMDGIKLAGGRPANFLDVGGSSNPEKTLAALRILLRNRQLAAILVNIFGGITRCDDIARGILMAREQLKITVPMIIRLIGTNEEEGRRMLQEAGMIVTRRMTDAIQEAVHCAGLPADTVLGGSRR